MARGPGGHTKSQSNEKMLFCCLCFSDDENAFGVTPDPLGGTQGAQGGPRGYTNSWSNEKMLLINVVAYVSPMTKMHFWLSPNPPPLSGLPPGIFLRGAQARLVF